jgi:hypothetical protein
MYNSRRDITITNTITNVQNYLSYFTSLITNSPWAKSHSLHLWYTFMSYRRILPLLTPTLTPLHPPPPNLHYWLTIQHTIIHDCTVTNNYYVIITCAMFLGILPTTDPFHLEVNITEMICEDMRSTLWTLWHTYIPLKIIRGMEGVK